MRSLSTTFSQSIALMKYYTWPNHYISMSLPIPKVDLSSVSVTTRWHHEYYCSSQ